MGSVKRGMLNLRFHFIKNIIVVILSTAMSVSVIISFMLENEVEAQRQKLMEQIEVNVKVRSKDAFFVSYEADKMLEYNLVKRIAELPETNKASYILLANADGIDIQGITAEAEQSFLEMGVDIYEGNEAIKEAGAFTVIGTDKLSEFYLFGEKGDTIVSGSVPAKASNGIPEVVVSEQLLRDNALNIGDTVQLKGKGENKIAVKISGTHSGNYSGAYTCTSENNYIYMCMEDCLNYFDGRVVQAEYQLKNPEKTEAFIKAGKEILEENDIKGAFAVDNINYILSMMPLNAMKNNYVGFRIGLLMAFAILSAFILGYSLFCRRKEIGVLLMLGIDKKHIILQVLFELALPLVLGNAISVLVCQNLGQIVLQGNVLNASYINNIKETINMIIPIVILEVTILGIVIVANYLLIWKRSITKMLNT